MELNRIFQQPVSRPIEGVIKADDESSLYVELNEYVLTDEVAKRLEKAGFRAQLALDGVLASRR